MLTGLCSQFSRLAALESGGTDFFSKPAKPQDLISKINALLAKPSAAPSEPRLAGRQARFGTRRGVQTTS